MPKWMNIKPEEFFEAKDVDLGTIPLMKYKKTLNDEIKEKKSFKRRCLRNL